MKIKIALISLVGMLLGTYALGASLLLSPLSVDVKPDQTFNVAVTLNPQGKIYSAKVVLRFSSDVIAVRQDTNNQPFTLGPNWMAPEGVTIDNSAGTISMLAGYPRGTETTVLFGTISFVAKKSGTGTISIDNESIALGADNKNALSGAVSPVNVSVVASTPVPSPVLTGIVGSPTPRITSIVTPTVSVSPSPIINPNTAQVGQQASIMSSIGNVVTFGTGSAWLGILFVIIVLAIIYFIVRRIRRPKNQA